MTTHVADTPRSQRRSHTELTAAPVVGVTSIPSPSKLNGFKLPELRKICADLGLESKGQKKDVVAMLSRAHTAAKAVMKDGLAAAADPSEGTGSASASATDAAALSARVAELEWSMAAKSAAAAKATAEAQVATEAERSTAAALAAAEATIAELREALAKSAAEATARAAEVAAYEAREEQLQAELQGEEGAERAQVNHLQAAPPRAAPRKRSLLGVE